MQALMQTSRQKNIETYLLKTPMAAPNPAEQWTTLQHFDAKYRICGAGQNEKVASKTLSAKTQ